MKKLLSAVFLILFSFTFSQSKNDKIVELLNLTTETFSDATLSESLINDFKNVYPNLSEEFWKDFATEIKANDLQKLSIPIYDKYYTEQDIDGLLKFYRSEVGRKIIKTLPLISVESRNIGMKWGAQLADKIEEKLKNKNYYQNPPPPMRK